MDSFNISTAHEELKNDDASLFNTTAVYELPTKKRNRKSKKQNEKDIMKEYIEEMNELSDIVESTNQPTNSFIVSPPAETDILPELENTHEFKHEPKEKKTKSGGKSSNEHASTESLTKTHETYPSKNKKNAGHGNTNPLITSIEKKMVRPKNPSQEQYVNMLNNKEKKIVFAIGPAGTGKTLFATQYAIKQFLLGTVDKIIFTRPTVSVDEDIGFLPGSIEEKLSPWLRPIFDILYEFITVKEVQSYLEEKVFEMAPIGYLRGRTFKRSFIIADEMQNCTQNQMKMLLTRLGEGSRMTITGDLEQHDRTGATNGLADFLSKLRKKRSDSIGMIEFEPNDILREPIIKEVLEIYSL
jgi:phosphate starvation-inducible PhoH-like protein